MKLRIAIIIFVAAITAAQSQIKIACVGNSITAGSTLTTPATQAYSARLGVLLGSGYTVKNEGLSGTYMQKTGRSPYWTTNQFKDVFTFKPNIITICLGTNDSRATQWVGSRFMTDYKAMIDTFSTISPKPQIWLLKPMPAWQSKDNSSVTPGTLNWGFDNGIAGNGISGFTIRDSVIPAIQQVARDRSLPTIDLYAPMLMGQPYVYNVTPSFAPDGVHPNALGHDTLAHVIYRALVAAAGVRPSGNPAPAFFRAMVRGGHLYVTLPEKASGRLSISTVKGALVKSAFVRAGLSIHSLVGAQAGTYVVSLDTPSGRAIQIIVLGADVADKR